MCQNNFEVIEMQVSNENQICKNCTYFMQHYIHLRKYIEINCGHCIQGVRCKKRSPLSPACPEWKENKDR